MVFMMSSPLLRPQNTAARQKLQPRAPYSAGKNAFSEHYSASDVNPRLDPATFDPRRFASRHWEH